VKYYIIAGEASGDLHASNLMKAIKVEDEGTHFRVWGGDLMQEAGGELVKHYADLAFMGFWEVAKNLKTILNNISFCKKDILQYQPDVLILVDYPGFNLRIAKWAKSKNIRVFYYISPQIWAWHTSRVHEIKKNVERMFVILPFEKDFYKKYNFEVDFVGHPLLDVVNDFKSEPDFLQKNKLSEKPIIALLPGSRKQEIKRMLNTMLEAVSEFPNHQIAIAGAPSIPNDFYDNLKGDKNISIIPNQTYQLLHVASMALVTSGTATLETGLFKVPQVVCYNGNPLSYIIAKRLIDVKHISLVNLIIDKPLVTELIQNDFNVKNLKEEIKKISDKVWVKNILGGYDELEEKLGHQGASRRAARLMVGYLKKK
jgi:lipid-A-disaccharide synthase